MSITEETWAVELRIWCIKIDNVLVLQFKSWVETSASELFVPKCLYSPIAKYFGIFFKTQIWMEQ
jgi:hypothetical protein